MGIAGAVAVAAVVSVLGGSDGIQKMTERQRGKFANSVPNGADISRTTLTSGTLLKIDGLM